MQEIVDNWFNMHGESYFVRYFAVPSRVQKEDSVDLLVCLTTLAEYQRIFVSTYNNNPLLLEGIDYCWTVVLFKARLCDIHSDYSREFEHHTHFTQNRIMNASLPLKPKNALYLKLQRAMKMTDVVSILKNYWCAPPKNFSTALNWKAFDYWYFAKYSHWPKDGKCYGPTKEQLSTPRYGVI